MYFVLQMKSKCWKECLNLLILGFKWQSTGGKINKMLSSAMLSGRSGSVYPRLLIGLDDELKHDLQLIFQNLQCHGSNRYQSNGSWSSSDVRSDETHIDPVTSFLSYSFSHIDFFPVYNYNLFITITISDTITSKNKCLWQNINRITFV